MIQKKYKSKNQNDSAYFTDNKQYLTSRNRLFSQNQYHYIRQGLPNAVPGSAQAVNNVYSANGLSHCPLYSIQANVNDVIQYIWIDGTLSTVHIPKGEYDIYSFNAAFQNGMFANHHYYRKLSDGTIGFLIQFSFDTQQGRNTLQVLPPSTFAGSVPGASWTYTGDPTPKVQLTNNSPLDGLGFPVGLFPQVNSRFAIAPNKGLLQPDYVVVAYKPSNSRFATQGGVSSSAHLARVKYDAVNTAAALTGDAYGPAVANELAYNSSFVGYTIKDKVGFPNTKAPVIPPTGGLRKCNYFIYRYS
jgi:hypothetical protein